MTNKKSVLFVDKRLFQCGSQEAGLVKYDKYTCKKFCIVLCLCPLEYLHEIQSVLHVK